MSKLKYLALVGLAAATLGACTLGQNPFVQPKTDDAMMEEDSIEKTDDAMTEEKSDDAKMVDDSKDAMMEGEVEVKTDFSME